MECSNPSPSTAAATSVATHAKGKAPAAKKAPAVVKTPTVNQGSFNQSSFNQSSRCDELPPARIWSHSEQVPFGGSAGPLSPAPRMTLLTRTFHGAKQVAQLESALLCAFAMVPPGEVDVVVVLDDGPGGETLARCLLELAESFQFPGLRVALEPLPAIESRAPGTMFAGKLEGSAGKDRSQYSNFLADRYTAAPVVGFFDAEVCFQVSEPACHGGTSL